MNLPPEPISVKILDRDYQFNCSPDERKALVDAAHYLDEQMREIKSSARIMALERIAVMTALNLADELLKLRQREQDREMQVDSRIRRLADEIEDALTDSLG